MRIRTFHAPETPLGPRLKKLLALPDLGLTPTATGPVALAVADDPAHAAELHRDFVGKLPVWLDLDAAPRSGENARARRQAYKGIAGADLVTVATRGLWEEVRQVNHRVHLLPEPVAAPAATDGNAGPLVSPAVGYCGPAGPFWDAETAINLAALNRSLSVHLGNEATRHPAVREADRRLPNLHLHPRVGSAFWRRLLVAFFPYAVDLPTHAWLPRPLLSAWAAGIPTVTTPLAEVMRLPVPVLTATTARGFAERIRSLLADPQEAAQRGGEAREFVLREHAPAAVAARLREALARFSATK